MYFSLTMEDIDFVLCQMWKELSLDFLLLFWWEPVREVFIHTEATPIVYLAGVFKVPEMGNSREAVAYRLVFNGPGI